MSTTTALLLAAAGWLAIGLGLAVGMSRRGHDPFVWWLLGTVLGPLALVLAIVAERRPRERPLSAHRATTPGSVDMLVGIDGSAHAAAALQAALDLFGGRVGRVALATVLKLDDSPERRAEQAAARQRLERLAATVVRTGPSNQRGIVPELVLLSGRPADELERFAIEEGYGLLVIGTRGAGLSTVLLGSTATALAARGGVPVLVAGDPDTTGPTARGGGTVEQGRPRVQATERTGPG
jgi:nucleotide-binding universal stress UspA family protein